MKKMFPLVFLILFLFSSCGFTSYSALPPQWLEGKWSGGGWSLEVTDDNVIIIPSPDDYQYETIDLRAWESSGYCYVDRVRETADEWVLDLLVNESIHGRYITIVFRDDGNGDLTLTIYRYRAGDKPKIINMKEEAGL